MIAASHLNCLSRTYSVLGTYSFSESTVVEPRSVESDDDEISSGSFPREKRRTFVLQVTLRYLRVLSATRCYFKLLQVVYFGVLLNFKVSWSYFRLLSLTFSYLLDLELLQSAYFDVLCYLKYVVSPLVFSFATVMRLLFIALQVARLKWNTSHCMRFIQ